MDPRAAAGRWNATYPRAARFFFAERGDRASKLVQTTPRGNTQSLLPSTAERAPARGSVGFPDAHLLLAHRIERRFRRAIHVGELMCRPRVITCGGTSGDDVEARAGGTPEVVREVERRERGAITRREWTESACELVVPIDGRWQRGPGDSMAMKYSPPLAELVDLHDVA